MTNQHYEAAIELGKDTLRIEVTYETAVTEAEERLDREYFQWRSRERGQEVSLDKIKIAPGAGEVTKRKTIFITRLNEQLYAGLPALHQRVPYVLPKVIVDLKKLREQKTELTDNEKRLLDYATNGLESIVGGSTNV